MTVEELVNVLDREVTFDVLQAYDREILFESIENYNNDCCCQKWKKIKNRIVLEFYPTDTRELSIFLYPEFM